MHAGCDTDATPLMCAQALERNLQAAQQQDSASAAAAEGLRAQLEQARSAHTAALAAHEAAMAELRGQVKAAELEVQRTR